MLSVALTGNVAAGKSTVAGWFAEWGATVIDADQLVRDVQQPGTATLEAIGRRFGGDVLHADGTLNRPALRDVMLRDPAARAALNAIVHPAVQRRRTALLTEAAARGDRIVVSDIPLLFEVLDPRDFDVTVLVDAPVSIRRARLERTRDLDRAEANRLIAAQDPAEPKRARSDIVIDNDGTMEEFRAKAAEAWQRLLDLTHTAG